MLFFFFCLKGNKIFIEYIYYRKRNVKRKITFKNQNVIENLIYEVREKQVMLDSEISEIK